MSDTLDLFGDHPAESPFDAIKHEERDGREWWSARELMPLLGYDKWERFSGAIDRARQVLINQGMDPDGQASRIREAFGLTSQIGENYHLTRYAAYLVAMNADPRKDQVAAAQSYFAVRTREAEVGRPRQIVQTEDEKVLEVMQILQGRAQAALERVAELEPKADAWDEFLSAEGDVSVNEAAKALSRNVGYIIGEHRLRKFMEQARWLYRDSKRNPRAYQAQIDTGRLTERARTYKDPETGERVHTTPQIRITSKGLDTLRGLVKNNQEGLAS